MWVLQAAFDSSELGKLDIESTSTVGFVFCMLSAYAPRRAETTQARLILPSWTEGSSAYNQSQEDLA